MKIIPVLTEKSMNEAKKGRYTFFINPSFNKFKAKKEMEDLFKVHIVGMNTINLKRSVKKNMQGKIQVTKGKKKVIITLKDKEKIDLFESKEK